MQGAIKPALVVGAAIIAILAAGYTTEHKLTVGAAPPPQSAEVTTAALPTPETAPSGPLIPEPRLPPPVEMGQGAPPPIAEATPVIESPMLPEATPRHHAHFGSMRAAPSLAPPAADGTNLAGGGAPPPGFAPGAMPPAAAADPPGTNSPPVLSYFQYTKSHLDTRNAFAFVLFPRAAVTPEEKQTQKDFCEIILASMDFLTPSALADAVEHHEILATYWPIDATRKGFEVATAFAARDCDSLIAWYDHSLARTLAVKAGVERLGGPLLITWPSSGAQEKDRDPLVVDFSKANHERAVKALRYWFLQLRNKPSLWTNRIREGTIRAELADAVNDSAGVMLAVLAGKWDTLATVGTTTATP